MVLNPLLPHERVVANGGPRRCGRHVGRSPSLGMCYRASSPIDGGLTGWLWPLTRQRLSLGDRACLRVGLRPGLRVVTSDRAWAQLPLNWISGYCVRFSCHHRTRQESSCFQWAQLSISPPPKSWAAATQTRPFRRGLQKLDLL